MSLINDYFTQVELALAAYSNLTPGVPSRDALLDGGQGLAPPEADRFRERWVVVDQCNHTEQDPIYDDEGNVAGYIAAASLGGIAL